MKTILLWLCLCSVVYADIDMSKIAMIESSGNPYAVSYRGWQYGKGKYQVSDVVRREYNQMRGKNVQSDDLFNEKVCYEIANWYMNERIPSMLRHYGLKDTAENRLIAYNFGIGNLKNGKALPAETRNYIKKYNKGV